MTRRDILKLLGLGLLGLAGPGSTKAWASVITTQGTGEMTRASRVMMGNIRVTLSVFHKDRRKAREAIDAAFSEMARLERRLSIFKPESVFSQINNASGRHPVRVGPEVMDLIRRGQEITRLTDGGFNMALGPASRLWGFLDKRHVPTQKERQEIEKVIHPENVLIDEKTQTVFLNKKGMQIDAGGIGKGFIAERARETLISFGMKSGMIALAGDIALFGTKPGGKPWRVGVRDPRKKDGVIASIDLTDVFISTSGDYERFFEKDGKIYHHILDSKNLLPARDCQSVTVISEIGAYADALATGIFVMGPRAGMRLLKDRLEEGIIIDEKGRTSVSPSLEKKVIFHEGI